MADTFRVLVTGARSITEGGHALIRAKLRVATSVAAITHVPIVVVQGECPYGGVDRAAAEWALNSAPLAVNEPHPADRYTLGAKAGPMRNAEMVAAGADICLAFPDSASRGTWDCIRKAADAGIPVRIYPLGARHA